MREKKFFLHITMNVGSKLKALQPTLRERKRFIVFEVNSEKPIAEYQAVSRAVWAAVSDFIGRLGCARAGIWLLADKYDSRTQRGIIRVNNTYVDEVRAALLLVTEVEGQQATFRSVGVSGILKKATTKYLV